MHATIAHAMCTCTGAGVLAPLLWFAAILACIGAGLVAISHGVEAQHVDAGRAVDGEMQIVSGDPSIVFRKASSQSDSVHVHVVTLIGLLRPEPRVCTDATFICDASVRLSAQPRKEETARSSILSCPLIRLPYHLVRSPLVWAL